MESILRSGSGGGGVTPGVRVSDVPFAGVPVRVYEPPAGGDGHLRRGLVFLHGGGWALGSGSEWKEHTCDSCSLRQCSYDCSPSLAPSEKGSYDTVNRMLSDELNTVVVSVE